MMRIDMKTCCLTIVEDKRNNNVLMVENLRGLNKGYINFPGGKKENNETLEDSNIRETLEETGIIPHNIKSIGKIEYQPVGIEMYIYYSDSFSGSIKSKEGETKAFWINKDNIPYDKMRSSDKEWVKDALSGKTVNKRVHYGKEDTYTIEDVYENIEKYKRRYKNIINKRRLQITHNPFLGVWKERREQKL